MLARSAFIEPKRQQRREVHREVIPLHARLFAMRSHRAGAVRTLRDLLDALDA
jgi:hypothetical protein